ncbi:protease inhibitor I42 family protein [Sinomonas sp. P47F7]|uniref:protease inhibitor I42 family protein n=1 Tax=Sinomonas sp. P47F7 TaxID=3410987 RepID=UPI003BF5A33D
MEIAQDSSETREVEAGAEFSVDLSRSGGAGYRWEVAGLPDGIAVTGHSLMPEGATAAAPPTPGAPIVQRFALRAMASGTITFRLKRPWEEASVRTHTANIRVR